MRKAMRTMVVFVAVLLVATFIFTGCTKYAKEAQLQKLDETKAATLAAEKSLNDCNSQAAKLEGQLTENKQALEAMKLEKETVSKRLAAMGN